jgi:hypothetical protein
VLAWVATPTLLAGQVTAADSAAVLLEAAGRFERDRRWEVAEALYIHITQQYEGTPSAVAARARLSAPPTDQLERTSRMELPVFGTLYGLWLGIAVPTAFGADASEAYGAGLLIGGPVGLFGSRAMVRARSVSEGQARAISWGGIWGTWQGGGWSDVLGLGQDEFCDAYGCYDTGDSTEELFAAMIVGGVAGIVAGALIARNPVGSGVSSGAQGGSIWGTIYGAMGAVLVDPDADGGAVLPTALVAGNVGLLAGGALAKRFELSRSRIRMINLGALVGGLGGVGLDLIIQPDSDRALIAIPMVTSLIGLGITAHATRDSDRRFERSPADLGPALLAYRDSALRINTPWPMPTLLPFEDASGRREWRPGISLQLFSATF